MLETIKLSHTIDGQTQSCELTRPAIALNEELFEWLQSAMIGIGFNAEMVKEFFGGEK